MTVKINGAFSVFQAPGFVNIISTSHTLRAEQTYHLGLDREAYTDYAHTSLSFTAEAYAGLVLSVSHYAGHWDNDADPGHDVALVWDANTCTPVKISTFVGGAVVDASASVRAAYEAYLVVQAALAEAAEEKRDQNTVRRGKVVVVARGRKVPKGTQGEVFWIGNNGYGDSVGLVLADGSKVFTALKNVDVMLGVDGKAVVAVKAASPVSVAGAAVAPAGLGKGALVVVRGSEARVFWVGQAKNGTGLRLGVEYKNGGKDFVAAAAVECVVRTA